MLSIQLWVHIETDSDGSSWRCTPIICVSTTWRLFACLTLVHFNVIIGFKSHAFWVRGDSFTEPLRQSKQLLIFCHLAFKEPFESVRWYWEITSTFKANIRLPYCQKGKDKLIGGIKQQPNRNVTGIEKNWSFETFWFFIFRQTGINVAGSIWERVCKMLCSKISKHLCLIWPKYYPI